jgi:transcriptional regulator with XRE-family HTH domain
MIREQFGKRLKKLRKELTNLSQENFANLINMDRTYYSSVENGNRNVSLLNISKIADGLNITISELFLDIESEE